MRWACVTGTGSRVIEKQFTWNNAALYLWRATMWREFESLHSKIFWGHYDSPEGLLTWTERIGHCAPSGAKLVEVVLLRKCLDLMHGQFFTHAWTQRCEVFFACSRAPRGLYHDVQRHKLLMTSPVDVVRCLQMLPNQTVVIIWRVPIPKDNALKNRQNCFIFQLLLFVP